MAPVVGLVIAGQMLAGIGPAVAARSSTATLAVESGPGATVKQRIPELLPNATWGLDRLDQRMPSADGTYNYRAAAGRGVHVYVVSTGIDGSNPDFGGRVEYGPNVVSTESPERPDSSDCGGHGTRLASLIGGSMFGVAKNATLVSVRAADCNGRTTSEDISDALGWIWVHGQTPGVVFLDLGRVCKNEDGTPGECPDGYVEDIKLAETRLINTGFPLVIGAGDEKANACDNAIGSPPTAITVGAVTQDDTYLDNSNYGPCVDIWAPGANIETDANRPGRVEVASGTAVAAAYVTGAVAEILGSGQVTPPESSWSDFPPIVKAAVVANATLGQIRFAPSDNTSPNRLVYVPPTVEGTSVALARTGSGELQAFGTNAAGTMYATKQTAPNAQTWNNWSPSANTGWLSTAADTNADSRVQLLGLTNSDEVWQRQQSAIGDPAFTNWAQLTGHLRSIAAARPQGGDQIDLFGVDKDGRAMHSRQVGRGSPAYGPWFQFTEFSGDAPLPQFTSIAAESDSAGILNVMLVDTHGRVWATEQTAANSLTYSPLKPVTEIGHDRLVNETALARDGTGKLEVLGIGADGLWQLQQTIPGDPISWGNWTLVAGIPGLMHIAAETNANGNVLALTVDADGNILQHTQITPGSTNYTLRTLPGSLRS
ncbi:S8 family serine peptidase [Kribbella sp. NBC_00359]|uniref:S8 family serine peptidase n=1 Tax=Kribbella sp. NBC_00359 TaxID=2975966 RepID=UPI002E1A2DCA